MAKKTAKKTAARRGSTRKTAARKALPRRPKKKVLRKPTPRKTVARKPAARKASPGKARAVRKPAPGARMKMVYFFGGRKADGSAKMKEFLGGKGANLAEMVNLGIPVPPGFTITTAVCNHYFTHDQAYPEKLETEVGKALEKLAGLVGRRFGDSGNPLLVSVRSGAPASMPGMMDTILNLGLNDETAEGLAASSGNPRFVFDAYRRFIMMYSDVVLGIDRQIFEKQLEAIKTRLAVKYDHEVPAEQLRGLIPRFKEIVERGTGKPFPSDPMDQLWGAIGAVFRSWNNPRAVHYRKLNRIPAHWGTAVNVQAMVFGNLGEDCATGVAFTRDPATGEKRFFGEWLPNAQGEDVVAGIRTPYPLSRTAGGEQSLEARFPAAYADLERIYKTLERHYRDMQDIEFTIEKGKLWMLQTRNGKRTGFAAILIAADMVDEELITAREALLRIEPEQLNQLARPVFDPKAKRGARVLAKGLAAGPGAATGRIALSAEKAEAMVREKGAEPVILVRHETSPEDIRGMDAAVGILTARGGMTSHAALVARQMGKVCVAGCEAAHIDEAAGTLRIGDRTLRQGEYLSLDGSTGEVLEGRIATTPSEVIRVLIDKTLTPEESPVYRTFAKIMTWADVMRKLKVRANADQPDQAAAAVAFGAEGIGLCRTEHMFFGEGKIGPMREMILSPDKPSRERALAKLLPLQRADFAGIFRAMNGRPVTVRTFDPPLHEFVPHEREEIDALAREMGRDPQEIAQKVESLKEFNPMLGHRGCRLTITYPEIIEMQARAIVEAAMDVEGQGIPVMPEIMIPFVGDRRELADQDRIVRETADKVFAERGKRIPYLVGTMIELPRAAITADRVAEVAEFFSFGTNDLTQTTFGMSRDDAAPFLREYVDRGLADKDPFEALDQEGVGALMEMAVTRGRKTRPRLKVGICGEHGGEPSSVAFCHRIGLDYVSCSPFRIPIARLSAAQAALGKKL